MRKLSIKRKKSFIGSTCRIFIYIETSNPSKAILLNGKLFELVGTIANGKELTVEISNKATLVVVAYSRTMPEAFNTKFFVKEGQGHVVLYTKPHFSPFKGNPFSVSDKEF